MSIIKFTAAALSAAATASVALANEAPLEGGQAGVHSHPMFGASQASRVPLLADRAAGFGVWEGGQAGSQMLPGHGSGGTGASAGARSAGAARDEYPATAAPVFEGGEAAGPIHRHTYSRTPEGRLVHAR